MAHLFQVKGKSLTNNTFLNLIKRANILSVQPMPALFQQIVQMLSIYTNGERLLNTDLDPATFTCLHGIRVISTAWVVMGDLLIFQMIVVGE